MWSSWPLSAGFCLIARNNLPRPQQCGGGGRARSCTPAAATRAPLCTWGARPRRTQGRELVAAGAWSWLEALDSSQGLERDVVPLQNF